MDSVSATSLSKNYNGFCAVKNLSFRLAPGELVAFLGPNGAGKSTTIKMLCGILSPSSGNARIFGHAAGSREANLKLGLVFGTRSQLYLHMTVAQSLSLIGEIYYLSGPQKRHRIDQLSELFAITTFLGERVRTLSLGERMRCEIVASLLHRPQILLADEPTIGLDIVAKNHLRTLIKAWQQEERTTLMLTSHDLSDVEALCDRCILIDHGEKQFDGRLRELKGDLADLRRIRVTVQNPKKELAQSVPSLAATSLPEGTDPYVHVYEIRTKKMAINQAIQLLSDHYRYDMQDLQIGEVSLEEVLYHRFGKGS